MKFIGLFLACLLFMVILLSVFGAFLEGLAVIVLPAFLLALVLRLYLDLDERLERIEEQLGLKEESKTLTEQLEDEE